MKKIKITHSFEVSDEIFDSKEFQEFFEEFKYDMEHPNVRETELKFKIENITGNVNIE